VETDGRAGIVPSSSLTASASASASGHAASAAIDGRFDTYWDSNTTLPVNITLDQGSAKKVQYLGINQREWSPTHPRDGFGGVQDSARIKAYQVQTSTNGSSWSTAKSGTLPSKRGVQMIDVGGVTARYVRLVVTSTWSGSGASNYAKKLRLDELFLGSNWATGGPPPPPPPTGTFEAEDATLSQAAVATNHTGFSGTGFVDYVNTTGSYVEWKVTVDAATTAALGIRYANGQASGQTVNRPMAISVNGGPPVTVNFPGSGGWDTWQTASLTAQLNAGDNTIRATATTANGGPNVDWLQIATGG
jgi:alpha-L-fucosidase